MVDAEKAETSLLAVVHEAEQQAGTTIRDVVLSIGGGRQRSSYVRAELELDGRPAGEGEVQRLLEQARRESVSSEHEVLHVLPLEVTIDGGRPLRDASGLRGQRLEVLSHVVSVAAGPFRNLLGCLERCHLQVRGVVAASYAAGLACLAEEEIERGCLVLDMGSGQTGLAHFAEGRLALVEQIAYGGGHVTSDLAWGLSTTRNHAERIKNLYGSVQWRACDDNTRIEVPLLGDHNELPTGEVPRTRVTQIVRARVEEIFLLAQRQLRQHLELMRARPPRSLVLTGGASELEGVEELAQELFALPVRRGRPGVVQGQGRLEEEASCAAASGAVVLALGDDGGLGWSEHAEFPFIAHRLARFGQWIKENF